MFYAFHLQTRVLWNTSNINGFITNERGKNMKLCQNLFTKLHETNAKIITQQANGEGIDLLEIAANFSPQSYATVLNKTHVD